MTSFILLLTIDSQSEDLSDGQTHPHKLFQKLSIA